MVTVAYKAAFYLKMHEVGTINEWSSILQVWALSRFYGWGLSASRDSCMKVSIKEEYTHMQVIFINHKTRTENETYRRTSMRYGLFIFNGLSYHSGHGCISDASLRRLIQRLRDISKRADLQISETSPWRLIKDVSSETSLRSLRFSQRRLWVTSARLILGLQTKALLI